MGGKSLKNLSSDFTFFLTEVNHLKDHNRHFNLSIKDISLINPNTRTCPIFRTKIDAELTRKIYERVPVLINERTGENPWGVHFMRMFDMSNDSHLFKTREQLESEGFTLMGNRFIKGKELWLPLYEAKMIWQYDHRFGTYEGVTSRSNTHLPTPSLEQYQDPSWLPLPWYWVDSEKVKVKLGKWKFRWLLGWRKIARATDERSMVNCLFPSFGSGDSICLLFNKRKAEDSSCLLACLSNFAFDYLVRQKLGGINLQFMIVHQLPIFPPTAYMAKDFLFIIPYVLELVYTSWDMKPFADDVWKESAKLKPQTTNRNLPLTNRPSLQDAIRTQWEENKRETGGHTWKLPQWIEAYPEIETDPQKGIPFPPFKWDEDRRAKIKAELDAYYAKLYGLTEEELRYILDPQDVYGPNFPGETFRVLKEKEIRLYGHYRTKELILKID